MPAQFVEQLGELLEAHATEPAEQFLTAVPDQGHPQDKRQQR
jgi:hypothetical protein